MNAPFVTVIIVTNNSEPYLYKALEALNNQSKKPQEVIIVDSGSQNKDYLDDIPCGLNVKVISGGEGIGFCKANNIGVCHLDRRTDYLFFLNPDAFPFQDFIEQAVHYLEAPSNGTCGAITGKTFGFDIKKGAATGKYDTTGIFPTWYGKWYDRGQNEEINPSLYTSCEEVPAICAAVLFARKQAIDEVMRGKFHVFNESFYMYKEDIELSLRLRKKGWKLLYHPALMAYHCRGWPGNRKQVPRRFRLASARNELTVNVQHRLFLGSLYSFSKYVAVKLWDI